MTNVVPASSVGLTVSEALAIGDRALGATSAREIWVYGEISGLHATPSGRLYCTLQGDGSRLRVCAAARDARWMNDRLRAVGVTLADGQAVRLRGFLGCVPTTGVVELRVSGIDPAVTVGATELARRRLRQTLIAEELMGTQHALTLPPFPQRVLLIGPDGAATEEFIGGLNQSPWKWALTFMPTRGEGLDKPDALAESIRTRPDAPHVIVLVRRAAAGTAAYDGEVLARAVCRAEVPVISVGSQGGERAIVDDCAWSAVATPAAAAELLCRHLANTSDRICAKRTTVLRAAESWSDRNQADIEARVAAVRQAGREALGAYRVRQAETAVRRAHAQLFVTLVALAVVLAAFVVMGLLR
jgi:exodeoxyribonuclease VII large subunit